MTEREQAARAIGFLEGLSAFLWSIGENPGGASIARRYADEIRKLMEAEHGR